MTYDEIQNEGHADTPRNNDYNKISKFNDDIEYTDKKKNLDDNNKNNYRLIQINA